MVTDSERVSAGWDKVEADVSEFDAEEAGMCADYSRQRRRSGRRS